VKFSANLGFLFTEVPFLERFGRAGAAGFEAVEYVFPYDDPVEDLRRLLRENGLHQVILICVCRDNDAVRNPGMWRRVMQNINTTVPNMIDPGIINRRSVCEPLP
jgi:hydroxypyruvate isomerase